MRTLRVLVVEDDPSAAEAHASYTSRMAGFEVAGVARSAAEALRLLAEDDRVDLILLDMHLPDDHGLRLLRRIRASGCLSDVIAVTSARHVDVVRQAIAQGVALYLIKPFTFATFRAKLEQYAAYRAEIHSADSPEVVQDEVDRLLGSLRGGDVALPKGLSNETLAEVTQAVRRRSPEGLSASEVADLVGASRVTARRYLEHLVAQRVAERVPRYGASGRPSMEYRWRSEQTGR